MSNQGKQHKHWKGPINTVLSEKTKMRTFAGNHTPSDDNTPHMTPLGNKLAQEHPDVLIWVIQPTHTGPGHYVTNQPMESLMHPHRQYGT